VGRWVYLCGNLTLLSNGRDLDEPGVSERQFEALAQRILDGYDEHGPSFFAGASGSFLLLLYDRIEQRLVIVSDRLASRPLFFWRDSEGLVFATDMRGILSNPRVPREIDLRSLIEFLRFTMVFGDKTLYDNVSQLPYATVLTICRGDVSTYRHWTMSFLGPGREGSVSYYGQRFAQVFLEALDRITGDMDETGLMLSGGQDSRMIAAALQVLGKRPTVSVTFGEFEDNDELTYAKRVADLLGFEHAIIKRPPDYYSNLVHEAVCLTNGCLYLSVHAHMLGLREQIRGLGIKTLLPGWYLEILFRGGYWPRQSLRVFGRSIPTMRVRPMRTDDDVVKGVIYKLGLPMDEVVADLLSTGLRTLWREWPARSISCLVEEAGRFADNPYDLYDYVLVSRMSKFRSYILPLSTRYCARERCVLFESDLLDLFVQMPPPARHNSRAYRQALQILSPQLARIPDNNTGVPPTYPETVEYISHIMSAIGRGRRIRKAREQHPAYYWITGDSYPNSDRLLRDREMWNAASSLLLSGSYLDLGLVERKTIERMLNLHLAGRKNYGYCLCGLITLALWMEEWA